MAVLARLLGIPSRVAYGFTSGTPTGSGNTWLVTTHDAHAWPELYFQGYGWLRFEPTPTGANGQGTAYAPDLLARAGQPGGDGPGAGNAAPSRRRAGAAPGGRTGIPPNLREPLASRDGGTAAGRRRGAVSPWEIFGLVVAGLIVLAADRSLVRAARDQAAALAARGSAGRPGRGRSCPGHRADRVRARDVAWAHAAWQELRDDLMDYGAGSLPSESPRAVAARAGTGLSLADPARAALGRIAMAEERARYAPAPADGSGLRADSAAVRRAIAAAVPRGARWRARLLPASVVGPALGAIASAADLYPASRGVRLLRRSRAESAGSCPD